jgi:hypothetical protein
MRAGNGTRTRDPNLGKVVLYQLSYSRDEIQQPKAGFRMTNPVMYPVEARGIEPLTS